MLLLAAIAAAAPPHAELHGDVKTFFLAVQPRSWFGLSDEAEDFVALAGLTEEEALDAYGLGDDPYAQGIASGRLKLSATWGVARFDAHYALAVLTAGASTDTPGLSSGVGLSAPELLPLSFSPDTGDALTIRHRIDRLVLSAKLPQVDLALGRQPVSFGAGRFFTPLDVVNPFHPATIDTEYKPGVDALRVDAYAGTATHVTAVAAWAGEPVVGDDARDPDEPLLDDLILAASAQATVGVTDLMIFGGDVRAEPVGGLGVVSSIGPVGVHVEGTVTFPEDEDPFVRAVAGADGRPTDKTTLMGEVYVQTFGAAEPDGYLDVLSSDRVARGEVWQAGRLYGALTVAQELTPLVAANASVIANVLDPSALVAVGVSWSVADNADVALGGYAGVGEPADEVDLELAVDPDTMVPTLAAPTDEALADSVNSEFGLYPAMGYLQLRVYF